MHQYTQTTRHILSHANKTTANAIRITQTYKTTRKPTTNTKTIHNHKLLIRQTVFFHCSGKFDAYFVEKKSSRTTNKLRNQKIYFC